MIVSPICQVLLFAYIGRGVGVGDDQFFVVGNALSYAAIPCLSAMGATIEGERWAQTLGLILSTPARRIFLFLGRSLPVIVNGWCVALVGISAGILFLHVSISASSWASVLLGLLVASAPCAGYGLAMWAVALRMRQGAVISNVAFCVLLVFTGVNVPVALLPAWMAQVAGWLPLAQGIEAARATARGASIGLLYAGVDCAS